MGNRWTGDRRDRTDRSNLFPLSATSPQTVLARATPPDIWYSLHPKLEPAIEKGLLSCAQLESIIYACQQHERTVVNHHQVGGA
jgi:hypothetical protein